MGWLGRFFAMLLGWPHTVHEQRMIRYRKYLELKREFAPEED